jgi:uncharacterized protein (DUF302 family)
MYKSLILAAMIFTAAAAHADNGVITKPSTRSVDATLDCLESALKAKGMTIFTRVDHSGGAAGVGLELRPTKLLIFGNPKLGTHLMTSNQTAAIDLPMKALAWEDADGKVWLSYNDPAYIAGRHGVTDRQEVVQKMTGALARFTDLATQPGEC